MFLQKENCFIGAPESLARYGVNPDEKISSLKTFSKQIESYALHVIEDRPISNVYSYFVDNEKIYIDEKRETSLFVDPQERSGLALSGAKDAIKKARSNPGQIIFWYSPPGLVVFESGTKYDKVKPYPNGQLYLLVGKNDRQIDAMAISVSMAQEKKVLSTFLGEKDISYGGFDDEIMKIKYFLTNPVITNWNVDNFLNYLEGISYLENFLIYKNVHNEEFLLSDILYDLRQGWMNKIKPKIKIDYRQLFNIAQRGDLRSAYTNQLQNPTYLSLYSRNGKIPLGGGCGGDGESQSDFDPLSGFKVEPLSTKFRLSTPSVEDIMKKKNNETTDEYGSLKFQCPVCNGEHTRPRHKLIEKCPAKGKAIPKC